MVPTRKHVQEVYVGGGKSVLTALKSMSQDQRAATLCMDQSTIEQRVSRAVAFQLRDAGADLVDAPVSGGKLSVSVRSRVCRYELTGAQVLSVQRRELWQSWSADPNPPSIEPSRY
jgi:hypothetical protein